MSGIASNGCSYLLAALWSRAEVSLGDLVEIRAGNGTSRQAYYLGRNDGELRFLEAGKSPRRFTLTLDANTEGLAAFATIVESQRQDEPICSPLSVLSCLRVLERQSGLPVSLKTRLAQDPTALLAEMVALFGLTAMETDLSDRGTNTDGREEQHRRIHEFLGEQGVGTELTTSVRAALAHMKRGYPVLVSAHVTKRVQHAPDIEDSREGIAWDEASLSVGTIPVPSWAPSSEGAHAVTALGVIPARYFIEGKRLLVLDSTNNRVNVWPTLYLRLARPRFILFYPS